MKSIDFESKSSEKPKRLKYVAVVFVILAAIISVVLIFPNGAVIFLHEIGIVVRESDNSEQDVESLCIDSSSHPDAQAAATEWAADKSEQAFDVSTITAGSSNDCDYIVSSVGESGFDLAWKNYFILMTAESSATTEITSDQLDQLLAGNALEGSDMELAVLKAYTEDIERALELGVGIAQADDLLAFSGNNPQAVVVLPFEDADLNLREVSIDGSQLLLGKINEDYPLVEEVWVKEPAGGDLFEAITDAMGAVNYDPEKISTIVVTGTSVVGARGLYQADVEHNDWLYTWRDVGEIMREADIAHISNEASFTPDCEQRSWTMVFCAPNEAFEGLTWSGIDVVGLTGNHILDYGSTAFNATLDMFEDAGIEYFGGGRNFTDAHTPAIIDLGTMKVAFLGYNMIPPAQYYAEGENPGSAALTEEDLRADITAVREQVDYILVDMQWGPEYERYPNSYQTLYGHIAVDAGADFVHGVHPHWVQPVEQYNEGLIFYSLGNFQFDQLWSRDTREGLMIRHYFYDGAYLGYEPIPTFLSEEMQPQIAVGEDRTRILNYLRLEL